MESLLPFLQGTCTPYNMPVYPGAQYLIAEPLSERSDRIRESPKTSRCRVNDGLPGQTLLKMNETSYPEPLFSGQGTLGSTVAFRATHSSGDE